MDSKKPTKIQEEKKINNCKKELLNYLHEKIDTNLDYVKIRSILCEFSYLHEEEWKRRYSNKVVALVHFGERKDRHKKLSADEMECVYEIYPNAEYPNGTEFFVEDYTQFPENIKTCKEAGLTEKDISLMLEISKYINENEHWCQTLKEKTVSYIFEEELEIKKGISLTKNKSFKRIKL